MTDPNTTVAAADDTGALPIQPTGSGVADLEIAYEQMKLAQDAEGAPDVATTDRADDPAEESAAHPS